MYPTFQDFRTMTEATAAGILVHEAASKNILWANPAACRMFGFSLEELRPLKAHHMSSPEKKYRRTVGVAWLQSAVVHGRARRRWKYMDRNGHQFLTDAVASLVHFQDGPVVMVQFRLITAEDGVHDELHLVNESLNRVLAFTSAGTLVLDEDFAVEDFSNTAATLVDRAPEELQSLPVRELGVCEPNLDDPVVRDSLSIPGAMVEAKLLVTLDDGQERHLRGHVETIAHDDMISRLMVLRDDTERVLLEREHAYQEANLQYLSRYNAMGDMAMMLAHELGQPLAAARNFASGIASRATEGEQGERIRYGLEQIELQLSRASAIVSSVRNYVKRIESTSSVTDLNDLVSDTLYFIELRAREHGITVEVHLAKTPMPVNVESVLIGQVVINLCFNAVDEISRPETADKTLWVRTHVVEGQACCEVLDRGRGMVRDARSTVATGAFSAKDDGAGIGLVVSEHIMERHGGTIEYLSNDPHGTCAVMRLPLYEQGDGSDVD